MTVHPMRPPKRPKPPKRKDIQIDRTDGGLSISFTTPKAPVTPFPKT